MKIVDIPFTFIDWKSVPATEHPGETGCAYWRTQQFGDIRVRIVEYSPHYLADHWCSKGHVLLVLAGELTTELQDGRSIQMTPETGYQVADGATPHRSRTEKGARLFIVD